MYIPEAIQAKGDYQACIQFHGHTCLGVTIGYQAAKLGMKVLGEMRAVDENSLVEKPIHCRTKVELHRGEI